jgi:hypothetical protein
MSQSALSPYQATLFVRRSARDDVLAAAREELASADGVVLRGAGEAPGNVLQIRLTFAAPTATEAERLLRSAFSARDSVLAISDVRLRLPVHERRRQEERLGGGGSDGPPGGGGVSQR